MKHSYRPRWVIAWGAVAMFLGLTVAWHLPLLLTDCRPGKGKAEKPAESVGDPVVVWEPARTVAVSGISLAFLMDPTVYLLPSDMGFSRSLRNCQAEPRNKMEEMEIPAIFDRFQAGIVDDVVSASPAAAGFGKVGWNWEPPMCERNPAAENWGSVGSAWHVGGRIASRLLPSAPALPQLGAGESLGPTLLWLGVNPQGDVEYVLVERSSGKDKADEAGVRFARLLRFQASDAAADVPVAWGFLKIMWLVSALSAGR
ncbi:MAG: hypothetical protein PHV34_13495 [Verrucomicrobiae bacterium]|nr:hypothetical protein [Verrucomicrobiae bacterium]